MQTLIIVHLSSLDSLTWHQTEMAALNLAESLIAASQRAASIVLLDQDWPLTPDSVARRQVYANLETHPSLTRFSHDEETDGWDEPMSRLAAVLRELGVNELVLGGVWATHDGQSGCVNATAQALSQHGFTCHIDPDLCAYEEEEEDSEPDGWLAEWARAGDDMACPNCGRPQLKTLDKTTCCYGCGWTASNTQAA